MPCSEAVKDMDQQLTGMIKQNPELKQKKVSARIIIYTDHNIIEADVHGFPTMRLTDLLNNSDSFVPLTDAIIFDLQGKEGSNPHPLCLH